ncbi:DNA sulfur modification protein DndE [Franconibacter sp. IITDAS19]|uniref:DNA sulfur modification protein DndE n=1 Tax=Franconibacter sp. IITDAS19 TaxID=2930569 RepID=UPI001FFBC311|nr:DNA sulfur modification protein DndE [Franconibacter sp. IITDAS19]MCK1969295.1 DNA sulfur modification protein DndE [Franconibacter sp. IITDAS19]
MALEIIRLSEKAKQQLITLKKRTGIENWNILCRWALCVSLAEKTVPPHEDIITDSNIEMTWKTFTGEYSEAYLAIIKQRIYQDYGSLASDINPDYFVKLHLHRGVSYLLNRVESIDSLCNLI